jgi:hypothetical protein
MSTGVSLRLSVEQPALFGVLLRETVVNGAERQDAGEVGQDRRALEGPEDGDLTLADPAYRNGEDVLKGAGSRSGLVSRRSWSVPISSHVRMTPKAAAITLRFALRALHRGQIRLREIHPGQEPSDESSYHMTLPCSG